MTFSFLLILDFQRCSHCGFLMLSFSPSPVRRLAPFSPMHAHYLVLDPDPLATYGLFTNSVAILALRLLEHSPFNLQHASLFQQPYPSKPCLVFKCRSSCSSAIAPLWLSFLRFSLSIIAQTNCGHREPINSLLHCSILQPNTFICSFDGILLFPLSSNYYWGITWFLVGPCFGVTARLTGSGVQQSRPP